MQIMPSLQEIGGVADHLARHRDLLVAVAVHEGRLVALHEEELHFLFVETDPLDGLLGAEALVELGSAAQIAHFDLSEGAALAGLDQLALQDDPELALMFENIAGLDIDGVDLHD